MLSLKFKKTFKCHLNEFSSRNSSPDIIKEIEVRKMRFVCIRKHRRDAKCIRNFGKNS
jgi:hypothetical protein